MREVRQGKQSSHDDCQRFGRPNRKCGDQSRQYDGRNGQGQEQGHYRDGQGVQADSRQGHAVKSRCHGQQKADLEDCRKKQDVRRPEQRARRPGHQSRCQRVMPIENAQSRFQPGDQRAQVKAELRQARREMRVQAGISSNPRNARR